MAIRKSTHRDSRSSAASRLWQSQFGQQVLQLERVLLGELIRRLHGDAVLWIGEESRSSTALERSMVRAGFYLRQAGPTGNLPVFEAHVDELPFQSRSLDGVVLHHALERVHDPRTALREVARVLAPGGRLILSGFNPWSLYGMRRIYAKVFPDILSDQRFVNPLRLFDWLKLLGLELDAAPCYVDYRPPFGMRRSLLDMQERALRRMASPNLPKAPFGGLLIVSAVKQAAAMRPDWRQNTQQTRRLAPVAYPRVARWERVRDDA